MTRADLVAAIERVANRKTRKILLEEISMSKQLYHYKKKAKRKPAPDKHEPLRKEIKEIFTKHRETYGFRRVHQVLQERGFSGCASTIRDLMAGMGLRAARRRRWKRNRAAELTPGPNLLQRNFEASEPGRIFLTDVTEFHVNGVRVYLLPILDCFNGEIRAYEYGFNPNARLFVRVLNKLKAQVGSLENGVIHSDQGSIFLSHTAADHYKLLGLTHSVSRRGNCYDNARMESCYKTLKYEMAKFSSWKTPKELHAAIDSFIKYYNTQRLHRGFYPEKKRLEFIKNREKRITNKTESKTF